MSLVFQSSKEAKQIEIWYQIPFHSLDVVVAKINNDKDIDTLLKLYEGLKYMTLYVERCDDDQCFKTWTVN